MSSHGRPVELEQVHKYLSVIGGGVQLKGFLGDGTDALSGQRIGTRQSRHLPRAGTRIRERRDTYERLASFGVTEKIGEFWIPTMVDHSDDLLIVVMDIMHSRPYVIDFAKVRLNSSPDFPEQTLVDNEEHGRFLFEDNWPRVQTLLSQLESMLIFYLDPKPHNIVFPGWPDVYRRLTGGFFMRGLLEWAECGYPNSVSSSC